ncbi:MAG TPA: alpha/beta fold hydrolase [Ilumatobacteraceae bacterium]|nr:alpha/beta fold hydrolase [Ilumatobacteraceae bacterium]HRB03569.1 alpha/beta fold hydrolase [Ilumatobacteraceae bacterium]
MSEVSTASAWRALSGPLAAEQLGVEGGPRMTFVHGFGQTGNSWKPIAGYFAGHGFLVTVVDLPGHGNSAQVRADLRRTADMLAAIGGAGTYVGYSLGGRACLHLAIMYPNLVKRLVLLGANPGIDDAGLRAERRDSDELLEAHMREVGLEAFLQEWTAQPLFAGLQLTDEQQADRLRNTVEGLGSSLRLAGTGAQDSLWPRLRELNMDVLALAGADDAKFSDVARQIADAVPSGKFLLIPNATHAVHLQQPEAVAAAIATAVMSADELAARLLIGLAR